MIWLLTISVVLSLPLFPISQYLNEQHYTAWNSQHTAYRVLPSVLLPMQFSASTAMRPHPAHCSGAPSSGMLSPDPSSTRDCRVCPP